MSCRQPNIIDVEVMYDHVPTFTQEKNYKPTVLHAVLINKNIPSHKHTFKYYIHGYFKKNVIQKKATQPAWGHISVTP